MTTASSAASGAGSTLLFLVISLAGIAAYWAPSIVAGIRHVPNIGSIIVVNVFAFAVVPWIVAMAWACKSVLPRVALPAAPPPPYVPKPPRPSGPSDLGGYR